MRVVRINSGIWRDYVRLNGTGSRCRAEMKRRLGRLERVTELLLAAEGEDLVHRQEP